jgi:hypothetical protein
LDAVPRTVPVAEGVDLMFTLGRCTKTIARFWRMGTVWSVAIFPVGAAAAIWGEASRVPEAGRSGQATPLSPARDGSEILGAAGTGATGEDCTAAVVSAACVVAFSPADGQKTYASATTLNATTIAVPTISFRCDRKLVRIGCQSLSLAGWQNSSSPGVAPKALSRKKLSVSIPRQSRGL